MHNWVLHHVGLVVRDMNRAIEHYQCLGIGPFTPPQVFTVMDRKMYGKPAPDVQNLLTAVQLGPILLELVQPLSEESVHKQFLKTHGEGISHVAFTVDDLDKEIAKLVKRGSEVTLSGKISEGGRFAYIDAEKIGGVSFALIQWPAK